MKCGQCEQPCSQAGHLPGPEPIETTDTARFYDCKRCALRLKQDLCECCGKQLGPILPDPEDNAVAAAARKAGKGKAGKVKR